MSTSAPHFFMSYSREDAELQRRIAAELRSRGINVWVDVEKLIPGSPAWEREVERSIRGAAGMIVLLSPASNNSEWVRREISFAEHNDKRIFPVLLSGEDDDSIPLRLSSHQHVDLRSHFDNGVDELSNALNDHLGTTKIIKRKRAGTTQPAIPVDVKKFVLTGVIALIALGCIAGLALAARGIYASLNKIPTQAALLTPSIEPLTSVTSQNITPTGEDVEIIVYTCQVNKDRASDQICIINADGSGQRQLTNSGDNQDASFSPDGTSIIFTSNRSGEYEIHEVDLSGNTRQLTHMRSNLALPAISPDNTQIAFTNYINGNGQIWLMDRDGKNERLFFESAGKSAVAPTWSPNADEILFAVGQDLARQLFIMKLDGGEPRLLSDDIITPGRTDWSSQGLIAYFEGGDWDREVWTINPDGSGMTQVTHGGNSQGPSFSRDGRFITYTAYTGIQQQDPLSCEIFVMDLLNSEIRQLTDNDICDYQPRWGR
jgi:TolB protein